MEVKKDIFVLLGAGHKGSVKISREDGKRTVKIECNLDFRPNGATLYLIGDEIAKTTLYDSKTTLELPFSSKTLQGCVVRTSAITMFGGRGNKAEMLAKIDGEKHRKQDGTTSKNVVDFEQKSIKKSHQKSNENVAENLSSNEDKIEESNIAKLLSETSQSAGVLKYNGSNFYLAIKPQLDEMFVCYKQEETLNDAVENSSWVHVDAEDGYYVVGIVRNGDKPTHICYGVPSKDGKDVPPELKNLCVWIPVKSEEVKGYWVIYQSAIDGEIVR